MTPEDRWAMFAAQALSGILANPNGSSQNEARLAAVFATELAAEFDARFGVPAGKARASYSDGRVVDYPARMPRQDTRAAAGRALEALSARATSPASSGEPVRSPEPPPAEASPAPSGPPSPPR